MTITNTTTKVKDHKIDLKSKVSIRQYCDPEVPNMGMEKYNMSIFAGETGQGGHKEYLGYVQVGNKKIYLTGLDINAESVRDIDNEDERERKILEIKETISYLEGIYGVGTLNPDNVAFWKDQKVEIRKPIIELDLTNNADLLLYYGILGRGYSEVAPSFEFAKKANRIYKFYLHRDIEVSDLKVELTKLRNKARRELDDMDSEDFEKMFKVAKIILPIEKGYNRKMPKSQIYSDLNEYIDGLYSKNEVKAAPKRFIEVCNKERTELAIQTIVREALYQNFIIKNPDQIFANPQTQVSYGRTENEVISFLSNPIHTDELTQINDRVEKIWK